MNNGNYRNECSAAAYEETLNKNSSDNFECGISTSGKQALMRKVSTAFEKRKAFTKL